MKNKKMLLKIIFDTVMVIVMMTLYNKNAASLTYHEIAGLCFLGAIIIHLLINRQWIAGTTRNLNNPLVSGQVKAGWIVDFLLFIDTVVMIITSLLISKKVVPVIGNHNALNPIHFCAAAVMLILIGIHLGLHYQMIRTAVVGTGSRMPKAARAVCLFAVLCFAGWGVVNIVNSSFGRWLSAPFNSQGRLDHEQMAMNAIDQFGNPQFLNDMAASSGLAAGGELKNNSNNAPGTPDGKPSAGISQKQPSDGAMNGEPPAEAPQNQPPAGARGAAPNGFHGGPQVAKTLPQSLAGLFQTFAQFLSIAILFALVTAAGKRIRKLGK